MNGLHTDTTGTYASYLVSTNNAVRERPNASQPAMRSYSISIIISGISKQFSTNLFYLPFPKRSPLTIEINPHFHHRQTAQCKAFRIIIQIYLIHDSIGFFVQFQLYHVEGG